MIPGAKRRGKCELPADDDEKETRVVRNRWSIVFAVLLGLAGGSPAPAANDLLALPAAASDQAESSIFLDVAQAGGRLVAVGERGHILWSDDSGRSWTQARVPTSVTLTAVQFPTARHGWAVGHDGVVLHSADAGESWEKQLDGSEINALVLAQVEQLVAAKESAWTAASGELQAELAYQLEDLRFFLSDARAAVREGPARPFMDLWFRNERAGFVVGSFGLILGTEDGGGTWQPLLSRIDNPNGFHYYGIAQAGDSLYLAGEAGLLFRSDDAGRSWRALASPYEGSFFGVSASPDGGGVVAFGLRGNAFWSGDGGRTWQAVALPGGGALTAAAVIADRAMWLLGSSGAVFESVDQGRTFFALPQAVAGGVAAVGTGDGHLVVAGLRGLQRVAVDTGPKGNGVPQ